MGEAHSLTDDEQRAWRALLVIVLLGMPEVERTFRAHGLVQIEYGLLTMLAARPAGERLGSLASLLNMSPSRLSHRMRKLVDRGLVRISPCRDDARVTIATITAAGRRLVESIAPRHAADVRRMLFDHLSAEQVVALGDSLGPAARWLAAEHGGCAD